MDFESLSSQLQVWLTESIVRGCSGAAIVQAMLDAGYRPSHAEQAVACACARLQRTVATTATAPVAAPLAAAPVAPSSSEILAESVNAIQTGDRTVRILLAVNAPRIVLFEDLLAADECDQLIALSRGKLEQSSVVNANTGTYDLHADRSSEATHFERGENDLVRRIERRASDLIGYPVENGEPLQVLYYRPGAEYRPHFDFFDPQLPGNERVLAAGGQRIATLVMYLNDVEAGGSTVFPEIGLDVLPRRGNALFFAYASDDGQLDRRSLHGGSPVTAGEKWVATQWIRQRAYVAATGLG